jgi:hypothetical protein
MVLNTVEIDYLANIRKAQEAMMKHQVHLSTSLALMPQMGLSISKQLVTRRPCLSPAQPGPIPRHRISSREYFGGITDL